MRTESSTEAGRTQGSSKSESKSEKESKSAEKASDEARKAADESRKASDDARRAAADANRASSTEARRQATRRAEDSARQATTLSQKANEAAQRAEQSARAAQQSARPGTSDARAAQQASQAAASARASARASTQASTDAAKTLHTLRTPGTGDAFLAASAAPSTRATSTAQTTAPLPPAAQAAVDQARQTQSAAQTAATASMQADQRVREAQAQVLQSQRMATQTRNALDKFPAALDPAGITRIALKGASEAALGNLSAARKELAAAQTAAASAAETARSAATTANQSAQRLDQLARQYPESAGALNTASTDTRRAAAAATGGAAFAAQAAKPQPIATVSFDLRFERENNGGQHDIVFDGAVVGGNGQVYPPGTDAWQVQGARPNNGAPFTGERIYYVNGIQNTAAFQSQSIQNIANATGAEVVGIHNSTESMVLDLQQCVLDKLPSFEKSNAATRALASQIVTDLQAGRPVHLMAHSQGGLVTSGALTIAKEYLETVKPGNAAQADALLKNIKVETFGSAAASWPYGPQYTHYINENDTVPMLTGLGRQGDPARQVNAGGDRAEIHFIRDDPRSDNPLLQTPLSNAAAGIPAHDFNDGYLFHRQEWAQGHASSADLSGASPVAVRDEKTNELQGYASYPVDRSTPEGQAARARRDAWEQMWQDAHRGTQVVGAALDQAAQATFDGLNQAAQATFDGLNQAGQATVDGLNQAGQALQDTASTVGGWLNPWD